MLNLFDLFVFLSHIYSKSKGGDVDTVDETSMFEQLYSRFRSLRRRCEREVPNTSLSHDIDRWRLDSLRAQTLFPALSDKLEDMNDRLVELCLDTRKK